MAKRRANQEGTVTKRTDGRWMARLSYLDPSGQRRRVAVYGKTQKAALAELKKVKERVQQHLPARDAKTRVGDWLAHWRATTLAASSRAAATKDQYRYLAIKHLEPAPFGAITLDRLKPSDVEALILRLRDTKLSDSTIRSTFGVLRLALDGAVRDGLLAVNPAARVKRPGIERKEVSYLSTEEVSAVLRAAEGLRYHPALVLIASTGMRRGEALGMTWDAVDLKAGQLRVRTSLGRISEGLVTSTPKTERSRRTIPLSPAIVAMLKAHRTAQVAERLKAANIWEDHGLVFCTELGRPVEPRNLLREIQIAATKAGIDRLVTVHSLRHAAATAMLEGGTHIKAVADLLGHSSVAITGDIYASTSDDTARSAIADLSADLGLQ